MVLDVADGLPSKEINMPKLRKTRLGTTGPEISPISLGSWHIYYRIYFEDAVDLINLSVENGINFFDVGVYDGLSPKDGGVEVDLPAVVAEVGTLIERGLLRSWGINNWTAEQTLEADRLAIEMGVPRPVLAQLSRSCLPDRRRWRRISTGLRHHRSVASGVGLAGRWHPGRESQSDPRPRNRPWNIRERIKEAYAPLLGVAKKFDATPAQTALAFCLANPNVSMVLVGSSSIAQVKENLAAVTLAEEHGSEIANALADLWIDKEVVH